MKKTAIILGATGFTGNILLNKLLADSRHSKIKIFTRRPLRFENPKVTEILCDLLDIDSYRENFFGDEVFCCIGTTTKKTPDKTLYRKIDFGIPVNSAILCKENGIDTFVVMSSMGANAKSSIFYNRTKGEMEDAVLEQNIKNTYILRPSIIGGNRAERRIGEKVGIVVMKLIQPLLIGSLRKYRAIKAETIATAMIELASNGSDKQIILSDEIQKVANSNL
jgi:uncharacterized protein YbjT (DUF2867 family)